MGRKRETIEQTINLSDNVQILVRWPKGSKPFIEWAGDQLVVSLNSPLMPRIAPSVRSIADTNGPASDTPEIAEMKKRLGDPGRGTLPFGAKTQDLFGGEDVQGEDLEALAASSGGGIA